MTNYRLAPSVEVNPGAQCPCCGLRLTGAAGVVAQGVAGVPALPGPGDFTFCISCGVVLVFDDRLNVRMPTEAEAKAISEDDRILLVKNAQHQLRRRKLIQPPEEKDP